jgi:opacity protein-like surface antigen
MKTLKLFILLFCFAISLSSFGQTKYIGIKYTVASTWLVNKQVSDDAGVNQSYVPSFGNNIGIIAGYDFSEKFGIKMNFLFTSHIQKYEGSKPSDYESKIDLKTIDIPVLIRAGNEVAYFEFGPVFSVLTNAEYIKENNISDVSKDFKSINFGAAMGGGADIGLSEKIFINIGFRFTGGFLDVQGVNALGLTKEDLEKLETGGILDFDSDKFATYSIRGGLYAGLKYKF